jgi:putative membrane protein
MLLREYRHKPHLLISFLSLFYTVGILLFWIRDTRPLFLFLTPYSLVLTFAAVLLFQKKWMVKWIIACTLVFTGALIIEIIGVRTGLLFGSYTYGNALGIKILDTPVLIGLNWLILVYCTAAIVNHHISNRIIRIFTGALLMVTYDVLLEYVAPVMDMWSWETGYPGIRNFLMWFLVAIVFHSLVQLSDFRIENKPARYLLLIQTLLFGGIALSTIWAG